MKTFSFPVKIYYEDTDAGGIVYHANYLKFFERARTEYFGQFGRTLQELHQQDGVMFVVTHCDVHFRRPAKLNDEYDVVSDVIDVKKTSLVFHQQLFLKGDRSQVLCEARVTIVSLNRDFRPTRLPEELFRKF